MPTHTDTYRRLKHDKNGVGIKKLVKFAYIRHLFSLIIVFFGGHRQLVYFLAKFRMENEYFLYPLQFVSCSFCHRQWQSAAANIASRIC